MATAGYAPVQLILVAYYTQSVDGIIGLVGDFERASRLKIDTVVVINNGGGLPNGQADYRIEIVAGANDFWEFSGWLTGLGHARIDDGGLTILLNDSYRRNWTIKWPGRHILSSMVSDASKGRIAGWLDNFTRTSRRINSRVIVMPTVLVPALQASMAAAIRACDERQENAEPLFAPADAAQLSRWMQRQDGRWNEASAASRWPRIFVEHHLFDAIPRRLLSLRPRTWLGSQIYGIARKLVGELR